MPLSATNEEIKAYQEKVEKNKITPQDLPSCPRCNLESLFFKIHAYRERRFLVIVKMVVQSIFCTLVRFRCTCCGKTFCNYPDFAIPHKHYTRQTIESFGKSYVEDDQKSYEQALITDKEVPGYPDDKRTMAASSIYRWISTLAGLFTACQKTLTSSRQKNLSPHFNNPAQAAIPEKKYKTDKRKECLLKCHWHLTAGSF